ncbi:MAG: hypothetical protein R3B41_02765 [Candidatus Doudnabacteria bacterium]
MFARKSQKKIKSSPSLGSQAGFSYIEILIALFVISISFTLFQVTSNATLHNRHNQYREIAIRAGETKISELRTTAYYSLPSSGTFTNSMIDTLPGGEGELTMSELDTGLTLAEVVVKWDSPGSPNKQSLDLSTYISSGGLGK